MTKEEIIDRLIEAKKGYKVYLTDEVIDIMIKILKQEPCEDIISRQAVLDYIYNDLGLGDEKNGKDLERQMELEEFHKYVKSLPPVTSQLKIGRWIKHDTGHSIYYDCSLCSCCAPCTETADSIIWKFSNYCPDCGAKMENNGGWKK